LQRNALSVAALSILVALVGLGFGLLQMITRPEPLPAALALSQIDSPVATATTLNAASIGPSVPVAAPVSVTMAPVDVARPIHTNSRVLEPNYTIAAGDTLVQIALRFNTNVDRIQAFNNLADPRALRIGTRLVIPPPL
jgi:LysM repeat protein